MIISLLVALSCVLSFGAFWPLAFLLKIPDQFSLVIWDYLGSELGVAWA